MISRRQFGSVLGAGALLPLAARAQGAWPDKPVRVIVPFGPGGLADVTIRIVGDKLSQELGQQIVVVNQPGPGGIAAARAVLTAPADGYTLALFTNGTAISVNLMKNLTFDPVKEFVPVSALGFFDLVIATAAEQPYKTLGDVISAAKASPGKLNIGTIASGSSQNLTGVLLKTLANVEMQVVPFRTTPDVITAASRRDVDIIVEGYSSTIGQIRSGALRALAVTGPTRSFVLKDVPTAQEAGVAGFDVTSWNAVFAPAGTPQPIVDRLNGLIRKVLADETVRNKLAELGVEAKAGPPSEIGTRLQADITKWGAVISNAGIERQ